MRQEIEVTPKTPMPKEYGYLPKGDRYKTLHCRKLTHEKGRKLYIVVDKNKTIGIRVPLSVLHKVHTQAKQTLSTRRATTAQRDAIGIAKAAAEIDVQFPKIPTAAKERYLDTASRSILGESVEQVHYRYRGKSCLLSLRMYVICTPIMILYWRRERAGKSQGKLQGKGLRQ